LVKHPNYWLAECIQEIFSTDPVHLALGTVAPGAGILAYGLGLSHPLRLGQSEFLTRGSAVTSTDASLLLRGAVTFALPTRGITDVLRNTARLDRTATGRLGVSTLDAKASLTPRGFAHGSQRAGSTLAPFRCRLDAVPAKDVARGLIGPITLDFEDPGYFRISPMSSGPV
jgi:hypothetical protein